jgi:aquaporin Z
MVSTARTDFEESDSYENSKYWKKLIRPLLAEFIGTTFFHCAGIFTGIEGNPVVAALGIPMTLLGLCGAFFPLRSVRLSVCLSACTFIGILILSGAHFNPAVSFAVFLSGLMAFDMMILYCLAQLAGGTVSAAIAYVRSVIPTLFCL